MSLVDEKGNKVTAEETAPEEEVKEQKEQPEGTEDWRQQLPLSPAAAFAVFVTADGDVRFVHQTPSVLELVSLQEVANRNIKLLLDQASGQDINRSLHAIMQMLQGVAQMLTNQSRQQFDMLAKK